MYNIIVCLLIREGMGSVWGRTLLVARALLLTIEIRFALQQEHNDMKVRADNSADCGCCGLDIARGSLAGGYYIDIYILMDSWVTCAYRNIQMCLVQINGFVLCCCCEGQQKAAECIITTTTTVSIGTVGSRGGRTGRRSSRGFAGPQLMWLLLLLLRRQACSQSRES